MKEARAGTLLVGVFFGIAFAAAVDLFAMQLRVHYSTLIRDCSITGAHIISNDTVIVCRVVKVDQTRAPVVPKEKPEITL